MIQQGCRAVGAFHSAGALGRASTIPIGTQGACFFFFGGGALTHNLSENSKPQVSESSQIDVLQTGV